MHMDYRVGMIFNQRMTTELSIVTAKTQTVIIQPKLIVKPSIVVKSVGNWVSVVVNWFAKI
jgi:hypothetical protein